MISSFWKAFVTNEAQQRPYRYQSLKYTDAFRLLEIPNSAKDPFRLHEHSISKAPPFTTLSYTWGSSIQDGPTIAEYANTTLPFQVANAGDPKRAWARVTKSLFEALIILRNGQIAKTKFIWADGLCINQGDAGEKASQVALMGEIYSRSEQTIVWLGKGDSHTKDFFDLHMRLCGPLNRYFGTTGFQAPNFDLTVANIQEHLQTEIPARLWSSYCTFCEQRRWFMRTWVAQEIALSRDIRV